MDIKIEILKFIKEYGTEKNKEVGIFSIDRYINFTLLKDQENMITVSVFIDDLIKNNLIYVTNSSFFGLTPKGLDSIS